MAAAAGRGAAGRGRALGLVQEDDLAVPHHPLPGGLELDTATGEFTGEPTEAGTFEFTLEVDGVTSTALAVAGLAVLIGALLLMPRNARRLGLDR